MSRNGEIRKLLDNEFDSYVEVFHGAYPALAYSMSDEKKQQLIKSLIKTNDEDAEVNYYGYFRDGKLLGAMIIYDFEMRIFSVNTTVGGIGDVCVALLHKREHVGKELLIFFHKYCLEKGIPLALLYPFRPDFYSRMGYGFGKKMNQYSFKPINLPVTSKQNLRFLNSSDIKKTAECFNRVATQVHGMILRRENKFKNMFDNLKVVGYEENNRIEGFIAFRFKQIDKDNFIRNNILIRELVYENRNVFRSLLSFLRTQNDQIHRIIYNTPDDHFHHLLLDPRSQGNKSFFHISQETNISGVGMMYRVTNTSRMFEVLKDHNFGTQSLKLKVTIFDSFLPENDGSTIIHFKEGKSIVVSSDEFDVEIKLRVTEFSSLIMGVISFRKLFRYDLAEISNPDYIEIVNQIFRVEEPPITIEPF